MGVWICLFACFLVLGFHCLDLLSLVFPRIVEFFFIP